MLLTPQRVKHIFEGHAWKARVEPSNYDLDEIEVMADEAIDAAGRPTDFPSGLSFVLGLGYRPVPVRLPRCAHAGSDGHRVFYQPSTDKRRQFLLVHEGLHNLAARRYSDANEAAIWLFTGAVMVPRRYRLWTPEALMKEQHYAPRWFIEARVFLLWESRPGRWAAE